MDVKVVIASHKPVDLPSDPLYLPVQVNAEVNEAIPGYQPDNTGNNISVLNFRYCELTALWWAWRNLEADYIGMCQYRRLFCTPSKKKGKMLGDALTLAEAKTLCVSSDVILPSPRSYYVQTLAQHFNGYSFAEPNDLEDFRGSIGAVTPDYLNAFDVVMNRRKGHMCNMFIMRSDILNDYCTWLFAVMSELDRRIDQDRTRILGYFAEHMADIWLERNHVAYSEIGAVYLDEENELRKRVGYLFRLIGLKEASERIVKRQK